MYTIYLTNFGYSKEQEFSDLDQAISKGKDLGFDFQIFTTEVNEDGIHTLVYIYNVIGGGRYV